jgi:hypothetical protein
MFGYGWAIIKSTALHDTEFSATSYLDFRGLAFKNGRQYGATEIDYLIRTWWKHA